MSYEIFNLEKKIVFGPQPPFGVSVWLQREGFLRIARQSCRAGSRLQPAGTEPPCEVGPRRTAALATLSPNPSRGRGASGAFGHQGPPARGGGWQGPEWLPRWPPFSGKMDRHSPYKLMKRLNFR